MNVTRTGTYVFVGEKRSNRAISMGVTWDDGRLAAKTLHEALRNAGIDPAQQSFINWFIDGDGFAANPDAEVLIRTASLRGLTIVALGQKVETALRRAGIAHLTLTHPAARGFIRKTERYQAHVATALAVVLA